MFFVFLKVYLLGKIVYYAVYTYTHIARTLSLFKLFNMSTLASTHNRR